MRIIGIIAEYNPFHLGHAYQIKKIKEKYKDSIIIALVNTCFTERGDISIINKWNKAQICLENGIDLVVEFPTIYSTQSADIFAANALKILNELKIDTLAFGVETDNSQIFETFADIQLNSKEYQEKVKEYLDNGLNYPTAMSKALEKITNIKIDKPNDLLALSYIKEIKKNDYHIEPLLIKRKDNYNKIIKDEKIISANQIRLMYNNKESIEKHIVPNEINYLYQDLTLNSLFPLLKYTIIKEDNLSDYLDISEGLENRIKKYITESDTWNDLVEKIKTKRYTYNRINRTLLHIVLNIKKEDNESTPYIRILGFNDQGKKHLNNIKKEIKLDIYNKYKPNLNKSFDIENRCCAIYSLITKDKLIIKREYQNRPIIK